MGANVLIVDDSAMMRRMIKDIVVSDPDLEVIGDAGNGETALQAARDLNPDIILLDIEMPVMDGIEFMKHLKLISKAKVIVLSKMAAAGSPTSLDARKLGAVDVIAKPSGAVSLDLKEKKGQEIVTACRKAAELETN